MNKLEMLENLECELEDNSKQRCEIKERLKSLKLEIYKDRGIKKGVFVLIDQGWGANKTKRKAIIIEVDVSRTAVDYRPWLKVSYFKKDGKLSKMVNHAYGDWELLND